MKSDRQKLLLFGSAAALRLLLFTAFPSLPDLLTGRVEISTPVTSFKRRKARPADLDMLTAAQCKRASFSTPTMSLLTMAASSTRYAFAAAKSLLTSQAPLLLPLFSFLPSPARQPLATSLLFTALDLLGANALMQIAESRQAVTPRRFASSRKDLRWPSAAVGARYAYVGYACGSPG